MIKVIFMKMKLDKGAYEENSLISADELKARKDAGAPVKTLIITMTHTNSDGSPKLVPECDLPLTTRSAVDVVITDLAVFSFDPGELTLIELMPGASLEQVRSSTSARFVERLEG